MNERALRPLQRDRERFGFGRTGADFLMSWTDERIELAQRSLQEMLEVERLCDKTFLDVGAGSGLFSPRVWWLGAVRVRSFDFDPTSVRCALELRSRFEPKTTRWEITTGDVLDNAFLGEIGTWDIVYAWGVLHHTGDLWASLANVEQLVAPGGKLYVSIYNDQGLRSRTWRNQAAL